MLWGSGRAERNDTSQHMKIIHVTTELQYKEQPICGPIDHEEAHQKGIHYLLDMHLTLKHSNML